MRGVINQIQRKCFPIGASVPMCAEEMILVNNQGQEMACVV